jgi:TonB family protein
LKLAVIAALALFATHLAAQTPPRYVRPPAPHYPFTMLEQGIEGHVQVMVVIARDGTPKDMWIARTSGHASFDNEALAALRLAAWTASPNEVVVVVPIDFVIQK